MTTPFSIDTPKFRTVEWAEYCSSNQEPRDMSELERIKFMENRDGVEGALTFCKQGMSQYRKALQTGIPNVRTRGFARDKLYRRMYVESLCAYRKYIREAMK